MFFQWFLLIFTKSTFSNKVPKNLDFGMVFGGHNGKKSRKNGVEKHVFFNIDFLVFFCDFFSDFGSILGGPGPSKNRKKIEKIDFSTRSFFKEGSGRVLGF